MTVRGLAEIIAGAGGTVAGMLSSSTGAGAAVGVPAIATSVATAMDGVAVGAVGLAIADKALGNFGDDLSKFEYCKKLACSESGSGYLTPQQKNQIKSRILAGEDVEFNTREEAVSFIVGTLIATH